MPTPGIEFVEPIIKAELSKHRFANLGGFLLGYGLDAMLFGMMIVMFTHWVSYAPKERLHIKVVLVSRSMFGCTFREPRLKDSLASFQYWVLLAGTACTAYNIHLILYHFEENFGKWAPFVMAKCKLPHFVSEFLHTMAIARFSGSLILVLETRTTGVGWWAIFDTIVVIPIQASFMYSIFILADIS